MKDSKEYEILISNLRKKIENFDGKFIKKTFGTVIAVGDGIANIVGLDAVTLGEVVNFSEDANSNGIGIVTRIEEHCVTIMLCNKLEAIQEGTEVFATGKKFEIPVGNHLLGRVIDSLGNPIDGIPLEINETMPVDLPALGIIERESVNQPLLTGIKILDLLIPIGKGQKQLILGDRQSGKTTLAIDAILNQHKIKEAGGKFAFCVYVAIGKKTSEIVRIYELLKKEGAMENTIIVATSASDYAAMQYLAPMSGTAIAEYFCSKNQDALLVFDDLTIHANVAREIALLMRKTPARGAYPGDIFYLHSRLLERAVNLKNGGSVTMLPIIETKEGDISDYIPTNVISITDGQIYLDKSLFFAGFKPAINIGLSVSRIGSAAQTSNMKKIAGGLKGELSQFREYENFAKFVGDLDETTKKIIKKGKLLMQCLNQGIHTPLSENKMIITLFCAVNGLLNDYSFEKITRFENHFFEEISQNHKFIIDELDKFNFNSEIQTQLSVIATTFLEKYYVKTHRN